VVSRIPEGTVGFFILLAASAFLSSLKKAGENSIDERALIKASSSCLCIMLGRCTALVGIKAVKSELLAEKHFYPSSRSSVSSSSVVQYSTNHSNPNLSLHPTT
jgi:hypothetical protein